jgi:PTS system nitrogen regulatory IIA component
VKIVDFISPDRIVPQLVAVHKSDVLKELAAHLVHVDPHLSESDLGRVVDVLEERERLSSTGVSDGVAIPHGKLAGLTGITAVLGLKREGLDFGALDNQPSSIFVALLAPENSAGMHLKALARISQLFKDHAFRRHVLEATTAAEIYNIIADEDARF